MMTLSPCHFSNTLPYHAIHNVKSPDFDRRFTARETGCRSYCVLLLFIQYCCLTSELHVQLAAVLELRHCRVQILPCRT